MTQPEQTVNIPKGRYLVTGAAGRMGTHALLRLAGQEGIEVRAAVHKSAPLMKADNIEVVAGDMTDLSFCKEICRDVDYLFHFAGILSTAPVMAKDPFRYVNRVLSMNINAFEAAYDAKIKQCVWLSSTTGYPDGEAEFTEGEFLDGQPPNGYYSVGWMTRYVEAQCKMFAEVLDPIMPIAVLRPTLVYSEYGDFDLSTCHFLPAMARKAAQGDDPIEVWGDGETRRDLIHAEDVLDACFLAMEQDGGFKPYNIGFGAEFSVNEILDLALKAAGRTNVQVNRDMSKPGAAATRRFDLSRSFDELNFTPRITIDEGVSRLVARATELFGPMAQNQE